jgi:hypothetical protein
LIEGITEQIRELPVFKYPNNLRSSWSSYPTFRAKSHLLLRVIGAVYLAIHSVSDIEPSSVCATEQKPTVAANVQSNQYRVVDVGEAVFRAADVSALYELKQPLRLALTLSTSSPSNSPLRRCGIDTGWQAKNRSLEVPRGVAPAAEMLNSGLQAIQAHSEDQINIHSVEDSMAQLQM